jgi:hypothetical protein
MAVKKTGISDFFVDLGKPISYFPSFRRITGTTNSVILLCQFLFWSKVNRFKWFFKDAYDLEEETGLTYKEQKKAREILVDLKILEERYDRIDHTMYFRINPEVLNDKWEETGGKQSKLTTKFEIDEIEKDTPPKDNAVGKYIEEDKENAEALEYFREKEREKQEKLANKPEEERVDYGKKRDTTEYIINILKSQGFRKADLKEKIYTEIEKKMHINPAGAKWDEFIEFAIIRHVNDKQHISKFLDWMLKNNPNPVFWSPSRFVMLWPQAFTQKEQKQFEVVNEPFVEKEVAPMPKRLRKNKLE